MSKQPTCYQCHQNISFDDKHIGRNGRKIPLDPHTGEPHDCPMRDKKNLERDEYAKWNNEEKDDHGNESTGLAFATGSSTADVVRTYVDHTKGQKLIVKTFVDPTPEGLDLQINSFIKTHNVKAGQFRMGGSMYGTQVWYEET